MAKLAPVHPGEILKEEFLDPLGVTAAALARAIHVAPNRMTRLINGQSGITADTALRLSRALRTTPEFWLNVQSRYDLEVAVDLSSALEKIKPIKAA